MQSAQTLAIACDLSPEEQDRCAAEYKAGLFSHVTEVHPIEQGYTLRFQWAPERIRQLGEFLAQESSCCAFLSHSIEIPPGKNDLFLRIHGPAEIHETLSRELFALLPPAASQNCSASDHRSPSPSPRSKLATWSTTGLLGGAFLSALCCLGPILGFTGLAAALATRFEPIFLGVALVSLGAALWLWLQRRRTHACGC